MTKYLCIAVLALGGVFAVGCNDSNPTPINTPDSGTPDSSTPDSGTTDGGSDAGTGPACESATNLLNKCSANTCYPFDNKANIPNLNADGTVKPLP